MAKFRKKPILIEAVQMTAEMLVERIKEALVSRDIIAARRTMRDALRSDAGIRQGYVANIAMLLHDRYGLTDQEKRNQAASDLLALIFGNAD